MNTPPRSSGPSAGAGVLSDIFAGCEGLIEIRPLPPGRHAIRFFSSPDEAEAYARSLDGKVNVHFGAGTRMRQSGTKDDVQEIPGLWADCDTPEAVAALDTFTFPPTLVTETSLGREQALWLFKEPLLIEGDSTIAAVEGTLRGIAANLGSDPAVCDLPRILRVPGTMNVKPDRNAPCRLLRDDGPRYDLADFTGAGIFREAASGNGSPSARLDTAAVLAGVPHGKRDTDLFRLASKLRRADVPQDVAERLVLEAAGKCDPVFPADEAREKVENAYRRYAPAAGGPVAETKPQRLARTLAAPLDLRTVLSSPAEPIPWIVDGWLARGECVMVAAEPSAGKSLLSLDLALAASTGRGFLTVLPIRGGPYRVLYLDLENPERLVRWRLRKLCHALKIEPDDAGGLPLRYVCQPSLDLGDPEDREALFGVVEEFRPQIVIIDSLVRSHRGDENSNSAMRDLFAQIHRLPADYDCGVIAAHHLAKPSKERPADDIRYRIRGASDTLGAVDEAWGLEKQSGGFNLVHVKCRYAPPAGELLVQIEDLPDCDGVRLVAQEKLKAVIGILDRALSDAGRLGILRPDLIHRVAQEAGLNETTASKAVSRELARRAAGGRVVKRKEGRSSRYWTAEAGREDAE